MTNYLKEAERTYSDNYVTMNHSMRDSEELEICPYCGRGSVDVEGFCQLCGRSAY